MSEDEKKNTLDRMVEAYENMLERVDALLRSGESTRLPSLRETIDHARERAVELEELTREEADKVGGYLERDLNDAARFMADNDSDLRRWLRFEAELIESSLLGMMMGVADRTRVELEQFAESARQASTYHTGEITGPGALVCTACGKTMTFRKAGRIPPCYSCRGSEFRRQEDLEGAGQEPAAE